LKKIKSKFNAIVDNLNRKRLGLSPKKRARAKDLSGDKFHNELVRQLAEQYENNKR